MLLLFPQSICTLHYRPSVTLWATIFSARPFHPTALGEWQRWYFRVLLDIPEGRTVSQVVNRRPLTTEGRVYSQASPCGI